MINFFYQVGYSGLLILLLGLVAIFMAIRGSVLIILIKRQIKAPDGIPQYIVSLVIDAEKQVKAQQSTAELPSREVVVNTLMQVKMKGVYSSMYFLKLCAAIGPLLGLLGTVLGMVDVFSTLSARAMPDPSLLAGGIWEALLTTVMGLNLAIPALVVHYFLLMSLRAVRNHINLTLSNIKF